MNEDGRKEEEIIYGSYNHKHRKLSLATGSSSASHLFSEDSAVLGMEPQHLAGPSRSITGHLFPLEVDYHKHQLG